MLIHKKNEKNARIEGNLSSFYYISAATKQEFVFCEWKKAMKDALDHNGHEISAIDMQL